ncbi:CRISPR system precrRNA processing endoribonuclease RAMP protein Cas6 [Methylomicrobium sp. Wu6]|uniref:CRISPR system precrRNA processing endoribonuclease RAMP protein Cas6 n=1 Tax=Methylomicrobium sp. Wu6 TaxID=3107928 RepID=UPI002DD64F24|nr:CRISPR system precrRNA processing endoribonuclease RAMP protein Cas6 [Methylomicrobium sp. Wu6]MEC4748349.1 CRISPR system precrRNA processing endoribonuclease RAMP protein Cas6 [Methylomicrobium sp. Wu6]
MTPTSHPIIPIKQYRFYFESSGRFRLPEYPGSAWRGAFGHALKRTVCVVRNTPCNQCLLKNVCAYSYIFETPPPAGAEKMRKYTATQHPFVLRFPDNASHEVPYRLDVTLFGHGQRFFPYVVHALQTAGQDGIGGHRQVFALLRIDDVDLQGNVQTIYQNGELQPQRQAISPTSPLMPAQIELTFHSPLRIKQDQKNLSTSDFNFGALFSTLLRRISMISYFHTDTPLETDFAGLTARARTVQFASQQLKWYDWTRYSSRQQAEMNMGGMVGSVVLDTLNLEDFWPYLWLGQWTHVGKATSMGMGAYSIRTTSLSDMR